MGLPRQLVALLVILLALAGTACAFGSIADYEDTTSDYDSNSALEEEASDAWLPNADGLSEWGRRSRGLRSAAAAQAWEDWGGDHTDFGTLAEDSAAEGDTDADDWDYGTFRMLPKSPTPDTPVKKASSVKSKKKKVSAKIKSPNAPPDTKKDMRVRGAVAAEKATRVEAHATVVKFAAGTKAAPGHVTDAELKAREKKAEVASKRGDAGATKAHRDNVLSSLNLG